MGNLPAVEGLPVQEALERLQRSGIQAQVIRTGELGRPRALRRLKRETLVESGDRVVRARAVGRSVGLVVSATFRRPRE